MSEKKTSEHFLSPPESKKKLSITFQLLSGPRLVRLHPNSGPVKVTNAGLVHVAPCVVSLFSDALPLLLAGVGGHIYIYTCVFKYNIYIYTIYIYYVCVYIYMYMYMYISIYV